MKLEKPKYLFDKEIYNKVQPIIRTIVIDRVKLTFFCKSNIKQDASIYMEALTRDLYETCPTMDMKNDYFAVPFVNIGSSNYFLTKEELEYLDISGPEILMHARRNTRNLLNEMMLGENNG